MDEMVQKKIKNISSIVIKNIYKSYLFMILIFKGNQNSKERKINGNYDNIVHLFIQKTYLYRTFIF